MNQLSAFMENKPGSLEHILRILGENHINITALTIAETPDFGILRMIVSDTEKAQGILKEHHITTNVTEVLGLELEDRPGALLEAVETVSGKQLNIEYMYAFIRKQGDRAVMIFRFDDIDTARQALLAGGFKVIEAKEITGD
jgi:hypothetical protein